MMNKEIHSVDLDLSTILRQIDLFDSKEVRDSHLNIVEFTEERISVNDYSLLQRVAPSHSKNYQRTWVPSQNRHIYNSNNLIIPSHSVTPYLVLNQQTRLIQQPSQLINISNNLEFKQHDFSFPIHNNLSLGSINPLTNNVFMTQSLQSNVHLTHSKLHCTRNSIGLKSENMSNYCSSNPKIYNPKFLPDRLERKSCYSNEEKGNKDIPNFHADNKDTLELALSHQKFSTFGKYNSIDEFVLHCSDPIQFLTTMKGKRLIIRLIKQSSDTQVWAFLDKIKPCLSYILRNNFGNFFCQGFFSLLDYSQRSVVWTSIKDTLLLYSCHEFANYSIQKLVDLAINLKEQGEIESMFAPYFTHLALSQYGTYSLQKILVNYDDNAKQKLILFINSHVQTLVFNSQGVCLVKKYIVLLKSRSKEKIEFMKLINDIMPNMMNDFYAHYALLCIIEEWRINDYPWLLDHVKENHLKICVQKYSSRIVNQLIISDNKVPY